MIVFNEQGSKWANDQMSKWSNEQVSKWASEQMSKWANRKMELGPLYFWCRWMKWMVHWGGVVWGFLTWGHGWQVGCVSTTKHEYQIFYLRFQVTIIKLLFLHIQQKIYVIRMIPTICFSIQVEILGRLFEVHVYFRWHILVEGFLI